MRRLELVVDSQVLGLVKSVQAEGYRFLVGLETIESSFYGGNYPVTLRDRESASSVVHWNRAQALVHEIAGTGEVIEVLEVFIEGKPDFNGNIRPYVEPSNPTA